LLRPTLPVLLEVGGPRTRIIGLSLFHPLLRENQPGPLVSVSVVVACL